MAYAEFIDVYKQMDTFVFDASKAVDCIDYWFFFEKKMLPENSFHYLLLNIVYMF